MALSRDALIDLLTLVAFVLLVLLFQVRGANALPHELRWTHPEPERLTFVHVYSDGELVTTVAVGQPDESGTFTTLADVEFGSSVTIEVEADDEQVSPSSNAQVYGDECWEWDWSGDGWVGIDDFGFTKRWGVTPREFDFLRLVYGDQCVASD